MTNDSFVIDGVPRPQGSLRLMTSRSTGRAFGQYSSAFIEHRNHLVAEMARAWDGRPPITGPVEADLWFVFNRPKSHYGTGRNSDVLKTSAPLRLTKTPDADKLARTVLDALVVAGVLEDDAQVDTLTAHKRYSLLGCDPYTRVTLRWGGTP